MKLHFTIRKMKRKDIPAVQEVAKVSWNSTYEGIIPVHIQEDFLTKAYSVKMIKRRRRQTEIFVAEVDNKVIGFANYSPLFDDGKTDLHAIYLYPAYQGFGIGTAFLEVGFNDLCAEEILLNVERKNQPALNFYHAKGFEEISNFDEDFSGHILHTIRMSLKVPK